MSIYNCKNINEAPPVINDAVITFGVFDGMHQGHWAEISSVLKESAKYDNNSAILTFDIDPDELFVKDFVKLQTNTERIESLDNSGVDSVVVLNFNAFQNIEACEFLEKFFIKYKPKSLHIGENFYFGKNATGDTNLLLKWGKEHDVEIHVHDLVKQNGEVISSTNLRKINGSNSTRRHR